MNTVVQLCDKNASNIENEIWDEKRFFLILTDLTSIVLFFLSQPLLLIRRAWILATCFLVTLVRLLVARLLRISSVQACTGRTPRIPRLKR